jgi:hypothetical protein
MFKFLKKNNSEKNLNFVDMDGNPLKENDIVLSGRYDLGKCKIIKTEKGFAYQSLDSGNIVSWIKMIDASTKNQKVKKEQD